MTVSQPELHLQPDRLQYTFGRYCLRPDGTLLRDAAVVSLPPKELQILRLLLASAGQIVPAEQLRETVWGEVHVSPESLPRCVSSLRARLDSEECIQTVYKRGYRFNLPVRQTPVERTGAKFIERRAGRFTGVPRLAILPFATAEGVPEYLGPGIAEQTMIRLSRTRSGIVDVIARASVFNLARGNSAHETARELRADLAITGTVTALPQHFRLRAEMIRVADAVQLWVEDFLVPRHLLAHADAHIAGRITARVRDAFVKPGTSTDAISLSASATTAAVATPNETRRSEAYALYLQACVQWNTLERHQMQDAIRGFHEAIDLDESLIAARVRLMHAYLAHSSFGYMRADLAAELARRQAQIVQSHSMNSHSVNQAVGWIHLHHDRDFAAASTVFARPQPGGYSPWSTLYRLRFTLAQGRFAEAVALLREALESDPYSPVIHGRLTWALYLSGDMSAALEQAKRSLALFPDRPSATFFSAIVFAAAGNTNGHASSSYASQATEVATRLIQSSPSLDPAFATLAYAQARQGRIIEARALLDRQQWLSRERFVMTSFQAPALVELGEYDAAIEALTIADEQHCPWLFELLSDPRLKPLHGEPVFERLRALTRNAVPLGASVA